MRLSMKYTNAGHLKDVKAIFGFHVWPASPAGQVLTKAGVSHFTSLSHETRQNWAVLPDKQ